MPVNAEPAKDDSDDEILREARKRYERASERATRNTQRYRMAMTFVAGNQWDTQLKAFRDQNKRPVITMDRLGTHINQVVNDQRENKPSIKVHPVDDLADIKTAEIYDGVIRSIERQSNAPMVYETASFTQVGGGQGAWRVLTQYADESAFEQDIFLKRILDPTSVVWDPDATEMDGSDAKWAFVVETKTRERFEEEYPKASPADWAGANDPLGWWDRDSVRCAEYYRVKNVPTTFHLLADGSTIDDAGLQKANEGLVAQQAPPLVPTATRQGSKRQVQFLKLGGNSVLARQPWAGIWIPLIRIVGNEVVDNGEIIYTGLTHRAMDAQRLINYQVSTVVELLSLQKTSPYIAAKGQLKGEEKKWANANTENPVVLQYTPLEINGSLAPAPSRQPAPSVPTGNVQAMQLAAEDLQWITGQHQASFGAPSNETSGKAINARAREGDVATYHYLDNLSRGILHTGRILVDLIPKIYDTKRILRILGEDDAPKNVTHDPSSPVAYQETQTANGVEKIYNLDVGRYDVAVAVGPSYGTKRQESVEAMTQLLQANPQMWQAVGDLFIKNQDWPGAQQMYERLHKMVPPQLLSSDETQGDPMAQVNQLQATAQQLQQALEQRTMALQQAQQLIQQAGQEIAQLQQQAQQSEAQRNDKTQAAQVSAGEVQVRANADVEIARIQRDTELAKAAQVQAQGEIAQIQANLAGITKQLADIAKAAMAPQPSVKKVDFVRAPGPDGRPVIVGATVAEQ